MINASFNLAVESLINVIKHETNLHRKVRFNVQLLIDKLESIELYIQNSRSRHDQSNIDTKEIKQIREAAHEAEDLISKYKLEVSIYEKRGKLGKGWHFTGKRRMVGNVSRKIKDIKKRIDGIFKNKKELKGEGGANKGKKAGAMLHLEVNVENVINFTDDVKKMVSMLTTGVKRHVISILGMGGSGKTALAMKLCQLVKNHFYYVIWVTLEQRTNAIDILRQTLCNLAEQMEQNQERMDAQEKEIQSAQEQEDEKQRAGLMDLIKAQDKEIQRAQEQEDEKQREHILSEVYKKLKARLLQDLRKKKYLVFIDNLFESKLCVPLLNAFPDDSNGSRILITSRRKGVALSASGESSIHFIPELGETDVENLFCKVVFESESCPRNLKDPKDKVVKISHGLPIVTVELGRLLKGKTREEPAWTNVIGEGNTDTYPAEGRKLWRDKLALGYDQLEPLYLFCFFYFGSFPANYEIPVRQLIQLWIAEQFIPKDSISNRTLEKTAEEYLEELIDRYLIQPTSWRLDGGVKKCRIHNVLRDLCLYESKNEDFLEVIHNDSDLSSDSRPRRVSLHYSTADFISHSSSSNGCNTSSIRSFLCFGKDGDPIQRNHLKWLCKSIPMVRVLKLGQVQPSPTGIRKQQKDSKLEDADKQSIPESINKLSLLKYLKLEGAELRVLPDSICELLNLVTLDLRGSAVNCLPERMWELQNLRHLYMSEPTNLPDPAGNSKILPSLQILSWLALDQDTVNLISRGKFPRLRKLGLYNQHDQYEISDDDSKKVHEKLSRLERLKITVPSCGQLPLFLELKSLTKLTLVECKIDFAVLGNLSNLQNLKVQEGSSTGDALQCAQGSFAQLRGYQMTRFPIKSWTISAGAMPRLQRLIIKECKDLESLPNELGVLIIEGMLKRVHVHRPCSSVLATSVPEMKTNMRDWCDIELF